MLHSAAQTTVKAESASTPPLIVAREAGPREENTDETLPEARTLAEDEKEKEKERDRADEREIERSRDRKRREQRNRVTE